jgi:hypothetical protein
MAIYKNAPPIITNGLTLYLDAANNKSYVTGSTRWNDLGGLKNSGSLASGVGVSTDGGGSITFPGGVGSTIVSNFPIQISGTGSKTVSCFFKTLSTTRGGLVATRGGASSGWAMYVNNPAGNLTYYHTGGGGGTLAVAAGIATGNWYNATVTYNLPTTTGILYLNGIQIGSPFTTFGAIGTSTSSGSIGNEELTGGFILNGRIATTLIYNRALSAAEVRQNYNALKTRFGLT